MQLPPATKVFAFLATACAAFPVGFVAPLAFITDYEPSFSATVLAGYVACAAIALFASATLCLVCDMVAAHRA
jgi:hypothetical protein